MKSRNLTLMAVSLVLALSILPGLNLTALLQATAPATGPATITGTPSGTVAVTVTGTPTIAASASATVPATLPVTGTGAVTATIIASASATVPATLPATTTVTTTATPSGTAATQVATLSATASPTIASTTVSAGSAATPTPKAPPASYLRAVNVSPDASMVDIYLNGQATFQNLKFGDGINFTKVALGNYTIDVRPAGSATTTAPISTADIVLANGVSANVVVLGLKNATDPQQALQIGVFVTDRSPTKGKARFEVIHAAPGTGLIDVLQDNKPVLTQIKFGKAGNSPINVDPGTHQLAIAATGSTTPIVTVDSSSAPFQADTIYTLIAITRQSGSTTPSLMVLTSNPLS